VEPGVDGGAGARRGAEARAARLEAVDRDEERTLAPRRVVLVGVAAADEDGVLDVDRVQLAGANADERERAVVLVLDRHPVAARRPEPHARREEEALPG